MTKLEKVIKGIFEMLQRNTWKDIDDERRIFQPVLNDALKLLKEQQLKWIPVSEGMPEEHDTIFAKLKGTDKWRSAMFEKMSDDVRIVVVFPDGTRRVSHSHTVDGKWECEKSPVKRTVTHWMQNPELP